MVIGAADFAVGNEQEFQGIPVSSWVFEENEKQGFKNYKYGTEALEYFSELIGPYSYEKTGSCTIKNALRRHGKRQLYLLSREYCYKRS